MNDDVFMNRALYLAQKGKGRTSPNPMVGCVVVKGNKTIAEGWHKRLGGDHAEVDALKKIHHKVRGARLFVNLEPCFHFGKTPPCVDQIIDSGIKEVIIGMKDPNPLTNGRSIKKLRRAGIKVSVGTLKKEAELLNEAFIKFIKYGMPFVTAKCAQTLDGKIAARTGYSKWITSDRTREYTRNCRSGFDAILTGINTVVKDDPGLNANANKKLIKVILDSGLKISLKAKLFSRNSYDNCIIAVTKNADKSKISVFDRKGINVIICPIKNGKIDLVWLFKELAKRGIINILIEGGSSVIGSALKQGLVDKMNFYIAPKILGDVNALSSVSGLIVKDINRAINLVNLTVKRIDKDIEVTGYVLRDS